MQFFYKNKKKKKDFNTHITNYNQKNAYHK
jgi:hypothetical protein